MFFFSNIRRVSAKTFYEKTAYNFMFKWLLGSAVTLWQTGKDNQAVPASRGSAPSNRIWNITLRSPKQQIWLRTALGGR